MYKITHIKPIGLVGYRGGSMKISTKGRYGLRALADLAVYSQGEPIALAMVAARQKISLNYLEQVFGQLRKAGLGRSIKGPSGG